MRMSAQVQQLYNWASVQAQSALYDGRQGHGRILRTWRWERPLYKFAAAFGAASWEELAEDKAQWAELEPRMAEWRATHR